MVRREAREDLKCFTLDNGGQFVMTTSTILMLVSSAEVSGSGQFSRFFGVYTLTTPSLPCGKQWQRRPFRSVSVKHTIGPVLPHTNPALRVASNSVCRRAFIQERLCTTQ